jgi:hypothetical protein
VPTEAEPVSETVPPAIMRDDANNKGRRAKYFRELGGVSRLFLFIVRSFYFAECFLSFKLFEISL